MNKLEFPLCPRSYNVLFVTIDSCRYDVALKNKALFLNKLTKLRRAETLATYTLPAHISFFIGILPILRDGSNEYLPGIEQIWRPINVKKRNKTVAVNFDQKTIIDYYIENNYRVIGAGGVSFFYNLHNNILPTFFSKFLYFGKPQTLKSEDNVPRDRSQFPLAHIDEIVSNLTTTDPFFLFVNCPETHVPYDSPFSKVTAEYKDAIKHFYSIDSVKDRDLGEFEGLDEREKLMLVEEQGKSLEWIDQQIKILIDKIPDNSLPTLLLVMSDHGEEFGDGGRYGHGHNHDSVAIVPLWCIMYQKNELQD
jgi:membrane-anchored protein YejM (alkaline phosphatase superfamily)